VSEISGSQGGKFEVDLFLECCVTCSLVEIDLLSEALSASIIRSKSPAQYPRRQVRFITSRTVQKLQFLKKREDALFET
jgi:hypothetical protein